VPTRLSALAALLAATAVWGSTFLVTKDSLVALAPTAFVAWRFGIAAVVLVAVRPDTVTALSRVELRRGLWLGLFIASGFLLQTEGLLDTPAGMSGFLTGASVMLIPLVAAVAFGARVGTAGWVAVLLCGVGLALLTSGGGSSLSLAAVLTLGGAACFAGHIAGLSQWATPANAYGLTAWSVGVAAVTSVAVSLLLGHAAFPDTGATWRALLYVALVATCLGFGVQAWAQSALSATTAAVVMTMEPVFAAAIATALGGEHLPVAGWIGGLLVVSSMFVAELGPRECCDALAPRIECC
jgi:drug/metabolite transporter (DMT)-like permease